MTIANTFPPTLASNGTCTHKARRSPWWKRKLAIAAAMLWLASPVLYLLAEGPVAYASGYSETILGLRGFCYPQAIERVLAIYPPLPSLRTAWVRSWEELPYFHDVSFGWEGEAKE